MKCTVCFDAVVLGGFVINEWPKVFKTKVKPLKCILGFRFFNKKIKMVVKLENNNNNNNWNGHNLAAQCNLSN